MCVQLALLMYVRIYGLCRKDILRCLCRVMENSVMQDTLDLNEIDPDRSYALTYDTLLKMLAIQMRFRYQMCCWSRGS